MDYRRNLPHIHPDGAWLFVTWRLHGTLPHLPGQSFADHDRSLDRANAGARWLSDPRLADLVASAIVQGRDRGDYGLSAWCVMPNHAHMLLLPHTPLRHITQAIKGATARRANQILARTGASFWQEESSDHYARDARERDAIAAYIERNPLAAGLAALPHLYPWSSASYSAPYSSAGSSNFTHAFVNPRV